MKKPPEIFPGWLSLELLQTMKGMVVVGYVLLAICYLNTYGNPAI